MGETSGSGHGMGFIPSAIIPIYPLIPERFPSGNWAMLQIRNQG